MKKNDVEKRMEEGKREKKKKEKRVDAGVVDWARLENEKSGMTRRFESYSTRRGWWQSG